MPWKVPSLVPNPSDQTVIFLQIILQQPSFPQTSLKTCCCVTYSCFKHYTLPPVLPLLACVQLPHTQQPSNTQKNTAVQTIVKQNNYLLLDIQHFTQPCFLAQCMAFPYSHSFSLKDGNTINTNNVKDFINHKNNTTFACFLIVDTYCDHKTMRFLD